MNYKKSLQNQDITLKDTLDLDEYHSRHDRYGNAIASMMLICFGVLLGMTILAGLRACDKDPEPVAARTDCFTCHNKITQHKTAIISYFEKYGVDKPTALANAVMQTKKPRLMAAMAVRESPRQKTGDGGRSKGYFQVQERHWSHLLKEGEVSKDPVTQALDSERILEALIDEKKSFKKGLNAYGGCTTDNYSKMILAELVKVP